MQLSLSFHRYTQVWQIKFHPHNVYNSSLKLTDMTFMGKSSSLDYLRTWDRFLPGEVRLKLNWKTHFWKMELKETMWEEMELKKEPISASLYSERWREHIPLEFEFQCYCNNDQHIQDWLTRKTIQLTYETSANRRSEVTRKRET